MDATLSEFKQLQAVALSTEAGEALESAGNVDIDTLCAVASVSAVQLREVGDLLAAGALERWYLVTEEHAYYASERAGNRLVAMGEAVKSPEATSKGLHRSAR